MKFLVHHEPHFDLRSEEVDRLDSTVSTVENTITKDDDGRMFLALAKVALDSIIETLPSARRGRVRADWEVVRNLPSGTRPGVPLVPSWFSILPVSRHRDAEAL